MDDYLMGAYDRALEQILRTGKWKTSRRTGLRCLTVAGVQTRYRLDAGRFPLLSRRKISPRAVFAELVWMLSGSTNNNDLVRLGCNFWTPWVSEEFEKKHGYAPGSFGPVYGFQLRHFGGYYGNGIGGGAGTTDTDIQGPLADLQAFIDTDDTVNRSELLRAARVNGYGSGGFDQMRYILDLLRTDPQDRRILFSLWNPKDLSVSRLPPCHYTYQVTVDDDGNVTGHLTQRSCDYPIGVPANIQFYSALTLMLAQLHGLKAVEFVHEAVDAHCYSNQIDGVEQYLASGVRPSPRLTIQPAPDLFLYTPDHFVVEGYDPGPAIKIPVAV
jgi:thymidylate synthase